uniref:Enoyl-[acyl-carrier-protein] reductase, mitochondrial n=1 Tax=Glossina pallidipes TaxID=7398 RepID=A0A1B0A213_GLOPL
MWSLLNLKSFQIFSTGQRLWRRTIKTKSLVYHRFGVPDEVVEMVEGELPDPGDKQLLIKIALAPINPYDLYNILGKFHTGPKKFPYTGGSEFVGEVVKKGATYTPYVRGDIVIPLTLGSGAWTTYKLVNESDVYKVPNKVGLQEAASTAIIACTAYRLLRDFVRLSEGDSVILSGANSAVGQMILQLCKLWKLNSIGIVRDRDNVVNLKEDLKNLGATEILTDKEIDCTDLFETCPLLKPKLALDCIGGTIGSMIAQRLIKDGFMVSYGEISNEPVYAESNQFVMQENVFMGFSIIKWLDENMKLDKHILMLEDLMTQILRKNLIAPRMEMVPFDFYKVLPDPLKFVNMANRKFVFDMREETLDETLQLVDSD